MDESVLLTKGDIVSYLKEKYSHMYQGNDEGWCRWREETLLELLEKTGVGLLLEAQYEKMIVHGYGQPDEEAELPGLPLARGLRYRGQLECRDAMLKADWHKDKKEQQ